LKSNGTHQLLVQAENTHLLHESIHTIQKNTAELLVPSKEIGLQKNAEKTKYTFMSCEKSAGHHNITMGNKSFESVVSLNIWEKP
jgi:hypothetical protein